MATTNFLVFNPPENNQESDSQYLADSQRLTGFGNSDIVPSILLNKILYQLTTGLTALGLALAAKGFTTSDASLSQLTTIFGNLITTADQVTSLIGVAWGPSVTFNAATSLGFDIKLLGNVTTSALLNTAPGQLIKFVIRQDAAGSRTFSWPSNVIGAGTPDTTANAVTIQFLLVTIDGTIRPVTVPTVS